MSTTQLRIAGAGLSFLLIFLFGFWLSRSGKPYNLAVFTIHKLVAVGAVIYLAITVYRVHQATPLNPTQILVIALTALCFIATIATGGLLSIEKTMPGFVLKLHQVIPYLTVLSTAVTLFLLLVKSGELIHT